MTVTLIITLIVTLIVIVMTVTRKGSSKYYFNQIIFASSLLLSATLALCLSPVIFFISKESLNFIFAYLTSVFISLSTGITINIEGEENLDFDENAAKTSTGKIYILNHQSTLDLLVLGHVHRQKILYIAKKEVTWIPLLGWLFHLGGNVGIDRQNKSSAISSLSVAKTALEKGFSIVIFPEGTRSNTTTPSLLPFKKGAFHLSLQSGAEIVPVVCQNYSKVYHEPSMTFKSGEIVVSVLKSVKSEGDVDALMGKVRGLMEEELKRLEDVET